MIILNLIKELKVIFSNCLLKMNNIERIPLTEVYLNDYHSFDHRRYGSMAVSPHTRAPYAFRSYALDQMTRTHSISPPKNEHI